MIAKNADVDRGVEAPLGASDRAALGGTVSAAFARIALLKLLKLGTWIGTSGSGLLTTPFLPSTASLTVV